MMKKKQKQKQTYLYYNNVFNCKKYRSRFMSLTIAIVAQKNCTPTYLVCNNRNRQTRPKTFQSLFKCTCFQNTFQILVKICDLSKLLVYDIVFSSYFTSRKERNTFSDFSVKNWNK